MKATVILLLFATTIVAVGCSNDKPVASDEAPALSETVDIVGEWNGILTRTRYVGTDSARADVVPTHFAFEDSTYSYYHHNGAGQIEYWYTGFGRYELENAMLELHDQSIYNGLIDWTLIPASGIPFEATMHDTTLDLLLSAPEGHPELRGYQRITLSRIH